MESIPDVAADDAGADEIYALYRAGILDGLHIIARRRELCHDCARMLGIVPEARLGALALELRRTLAFLVQMKIDLNLIEARRQGVECLGRDALLGH